MKEKYIAANLSYNLDYKCDDLGKLIEVLERYLEENHFEIFHKNEDQTVIRAMYGKRLLALLVGIIPFAQHLPVGKRFLLEIIITKSDTGFKISLKIAPWDELWQMEEAVVLTQGILEKVSDDWHASNMLFSCAKNVCQELSIEPPVELKNYTYKELSIDLFLGLLIYPLDGYKSIKKVHLPPNNGPIFNWGGLLIPELYFLYNEIWGVFLGYLFISIVTSNAFNYLQDLHLIKADYTLTVMVFVALISRFIFALLGNRIYYLKHGRWP